MAHPKAVSCVIFSENRDQVLLIKRRDIPVWVLPGGGIEPGENPSEAAMREAEEETGFRIASVRLVAHYTPLNRLTQPTHLFECTIASGHPQIGPETKEIAFFSFDRLPSLLPKFYINWIRDALENHTEVLEKPIYDTSYWMLVRYLLSHPLLVGRFLLTKLGIHLNSR